MPDDQTIIEEPSSAASSATVDIDGGDAETTDSVLSSSTASDTASSDLPAIAATDSSTPDLSALEPTPEPTLEPALSGELEQPPPIIFETMIDLSNFFSVNIDALYSYLNLFAPIAGVAGMGPVMQNYTIDFADTATDEQKQNAYAALQSWPEHSEKLRLAKHNYQLVDNWFNEQIAAGYTTSAGFTLGLLPNDVALLTGNYILSKTSVELGMPLPPIIDATGTPQILASLENLTYIMLEYGQYRAGLSVIYAARKAEITAALNQLVAATD